MHGRVGSGTEIVSGGLMTVNLHATFSQSVSLTLKLSEFHSQFLSPRKCKPLIEMT